MSNQTTDLHAFVLVLFLLSLPLSHNGVEGGRELSESEDLELEKQLKFLNKPAVKTILTEHGDLYDCVDFYKQPAFDHPLLKNHSFHFQMKPTLLLHARKRDQVGSKVRESVHIGLKDGGCPVGTVPIRRITKDDLIRERNESKRMPLADNTLGAHYAVVRTKAGPDKFNGAGARLSLYNPPVSGSQYSAARIKVQNGNDAIQVGWRADPALYGDTRTRGFIRLDAGQSHCFNVRCPGFILVRSDFPVDAIYQPISKRGGPIYEVQLYIERDLAVGNWWLLVGDDFTKVGFWPSRIFSGGLAGLASYAEWGGEVFGPPGTPTPEMGSGSILQEDTNYDAFLGNIEVFNGAGRNVDAYNTETYADKKDSYDVEDIQHAKSFRHLVIYGGPATRSGV